MSVLLDTAVLIDFLRGHAAARELIAGLGERPHCSEVTRIEIWRGVRTDERGPTERLFATLRWHHLDEQTARRAGELGREWRKSHPGLGVADLAIAATADVHGLPLVTTNVRHYPMLEGLAPPYEQ